MINIHTGIQRKTIVVTFIMIVMMMVFVSCNKVEKDDVKVQNTAFSMGTSFTSTLYGKDQESLEKELISIEAIPAPSWSRPPSGLVSRGPPRARTPVLTPVVIPASSWSWPPSGLVSQGLPRARRPVLTPVVIPAPSWS